MTGHESIIDLRLRGFKPDACHLTVYERVPVYRWGWDHPEQCINNRWSPEVHILPDDVVQTLDLRFLRDMLVNILGWEKSRTLAAFYRVVEFLPAAAAVSIENTFLFYTPEKGVVDLNTEERLAA